MKTMCPSGYHHNAFVEIYALGHMMCVCVFILFHLLASSDCKTSVTYLRCSDQRSFVESIARGFCQVPSSPFPNLPEN